MQISMSMQGIDTKSGLLEDKSGVVQGSAGSRYGYTDFGEFGVQSGVPTGLTKRGYQASAPQNEAIIDDATYGHGFTYQTAVGEDYDRLAYTIDAFDGAMPDFGEILIAFEWPTYDANTRIMGPAMMLGTLADAANSDGQIGGVYLKPGDYESFVIRVIDNSGSILCAGDITANESGLAGNIAYMRMRIDEGATAGRGDFYVKTWLGTMQDEPAGWDASSVNTWDYEDGGDLIGFGMETLTAQELQTIFFFGFSQVPDTIATPEPSW
jgi:hypothetical protein